MKTVQAVLFDMDGTLLNPIDDGLPAFKERWGIVRYELVVPNLPKLPLEAEQEFMALERRVARDSAVRSGVRELLADLERAGVGVAIVTNNSAESVNTVLTKHEIAVSVVRTRENGPMKPAPEMIVQALEILEVEPANAILVGDTLADSGAATNAGLQACFLMAEPWNAILEDAEASVPIVRVQGVPELRVHLERLGVFDLKLEMPA
jgi:HAD superfamily hydrolase (TIGR01509 family)